MSNKTLTFIILFLLVLCAGTFGAFYLKIHPEMSLSQKIFGNKVVPVVEENSNLADPFGNTTNTDNIDTPTDSNTIDNTVDSANSKTKDNVTITMNGNANETVIPNDTKLPEVKAAPVKTETPVAPVDNVNTGPITQTLKKGSSGAQVKILQQFLIDNKYLTGLADGAFGPMTETAVKKFQTANKITADGIVAGVTQSKVNELIAG